MRATLIAAVAALFTMLVLSGAARADRKFHTLPGGGKQLKLRVVSYDGATNGELTVEVKNTGKKAAKFSAEGLYFVPDGDPDKAPQRLGAVGPMQIARAEERVEAITVEPGESVQLVLDVFCIDSHRDSPSSRTAFTVSAKRMPKDLTQTIAKRSKAAADEEGGYAQPAAKAKVQHEVWQSRDKDWVKLEGEGDQEAGK